MSTSSFTKTFTVVIALVTLNPHILEISMQIYPLITSLQKRTFALETVVNKPQLLGCLHLFYGVSILCDNIHLCHPPHIYESVITLNWTYMLF